MAKSALVSKRMAASKAQGMSGRQAAAERRAKIGLNAFKFTGTAKPKTPISTSVQTVWAKAPTQASAKSASRSTSSFASPKMAGMKTATGAGYTPAPGTTQKKTSTAWGVYSGPKSASGKRRSWF
jgi:hypothetical protein